MTARDSYRKPISSFEAIQELKRVAGAQLDAEYVELFIKILAGKDVRFRHGEDADFDAELGLDKRVAEYSLPLDLEERLRRANRPATTRGRVTPEPAQAAARAAPSSWATRSGGTMLTPGPVPSSKPARRVSRAPRRCASGSARRPRGAVRTQRFSGGGRRAWLEPQQALVQQARARGPASAKRGSCRRGTS